MQLAGILRPARSLLVLFACAAGAVHAAEVSAPVMLVATERLAGSGYRETVLIRHPAQGASRFIINPPPGEARVLFPQLRPPQVSPLYFAPRAPPTLFLIPPRTQKQRRGRPSPPPLPPPPTQTHTPPPPLPQTPPR